MPLTLERTASIADFKAKIGEYADAVAGGESFVVTRYNKPVFKVVPVSPGGKLPHGRGILNRYADISKIPFEKGAWAADVMERADDFM